MRIFLILLYLFSTSSIAEQKFEYQGVYEGVKFFRNQEVKGVSYLYLDLLRPNGSFVQKDNIASDEKAMKCSVVSKNIVWNPPTAKIPLHQCESNPFDHDYELLLVLDAAMIKGSTFSLDSDALVTLITKSNDVAISSVSMWLRRTEKKSLLEQLKNTAPYN